MKRGDWQRIKSNKKQNKRIIRKRRGTRKASIVEGRRGRRADGGADPKSWAKEGVKGVCTCPWEEFKALFFSFLASLAHAYHQDSVGRRKKATRQNKSER